MAEVLVLYYSAGGSVRRMAELIAEGVERVPGAQARIRTVARIIDEKIENSPAKAGVGRDMVEPEQLPEH